MRVLDLCAEPDVDLVPVVAHIRSGGLVAYPTETVYGIGGVCSIEASMCVRELKGREEAKPLIAELIEFATRPENIYTHKWSESDAVLWDNRAIVHRGRPFARDKHARVMIRTTIAGAGSKDVVKAA